MRRSTDSKSGVAASRDFPWKSEPGCAFTAKYIYVCAHVTLHGCPIRPFRAFSRVCATTYNFALHLANNIRLPRATVSNACAVRCSFRAVWCPMAVLLRLGTVAPLYLFIYFFFLPWTRTCYFFLVVKSPNESNVRTMLATLLRYRDKYSSTFSGRPGFWYALHLPYYCI